MRLGFVWLVGLLASVGALGQESAIDSLTLYHAATALNSGKIIFLFNAQK